MGKKQSFRPEAQAHSPSVEGVEALLLLLARLLEAQTQARQADESLPWPSAVELAAQTGANLEAVKKRLQQLNSWEVLQLVEHAPKRYRFNPFIYRQTNPSAPLLALLEALLIEPEPEAEQIQEVLATLEKKDKGRIKRRY